MPESNILTQGGGESRTENHSYSRYYHDGAVKV